MRRNILNVTANMHRWKLSALAAAAFVSAAMTTTDAAALALGPLNVESTLGENLRAEIAIPQATAAELSSLVAQIASPDIFRAQGMDYSSAARAIQVQLLRKPDGTASLRLSSNAPLQDPFVDLVIETQWSTGHLVRSYTLLLDPPAAQRQPSASMTAPQVAAAAPAAVTGKTYSSNNAPRPSAPAVSAAPAVPPTPKPSPAPATEDTTRVRAGDTAGRIANANRPSGVSLDQMLVAMLRSNPDAFINGNVNRIRAGAVVQMPSREQALETSAPEARKIVAAQSRDFNAYRRSMAAKAPQAAVQAADRSSSGQVQAQVSDTRPAADTPDKLTLSKGAVQNAAAAEEKLAAQKQADDQDNRLNELQRNLAELNELAGSNTTQPQAAPNVEAPSNAPTAANTAQAAASATPAPSPTPELAINNATAAAAAETTTALEAGATPAAAPTAPEDTNTAASPSAAEQPAKPLPSSSVTPAPNTEPSMVDELLENPLVPAGAGLVALLLGLLGYSAWKRRRAAQAVQDPSMGDSQLQTDSFFGGSGGQQVDTSSAHGGASTMAYAPSQLDGGGDVDPVAEADVYLAYGRDVQAEEILKEALRNQPERLSVHVKLAEIYVKRHDIKGLEGIARGLQEVSHAQAPEWQRVVEMGRHMDPTNPFFAAAGTANAASAAQPTSAFAAALNSIQPASTAAGLAGAATPFTAAQQIPDIDLNLDLPDDGLASANTVASAPSMVPLPSDDDFAALDLPSTLDSQMDLSAAPDAHNPPTLVQDTLMPDDTRAQDVNGLDLDLSAFDISPAAPETRPVTAPVTAPAAPEADMDFGSGLNFDLDTPAASPAVEPPAPETQSPAPDAPVGLDFDLGSLDLDLGPTTEPAAQAQPVHNLADDPLSTKLDLAQEFNTIGDSEGARALIEEVLAEANGPLKDRAQKMLSELD